jgi:ACDE family multidrug resistance protein
MSPYGRRAGDKECKLYWDRNLNIVFGISLMGVLGVASVTPAFPKMVEELGVSPQRIGLLVTVFTLPGVVLAPIVGMLSDKFGRKKILVPSLLLFGSVGSACAFVRNFDLLLIFRFVQGMGAAGLGAMAHTIISDLYTGKQRPTALGYNSSVLNLGISCYPAIGGALAVLGWHYPFALPLLAIPVGLSVLFSLDSPEARNEQPFKEYLANVWEYIRDLRVLGLYVTSLVSTAIRLGPVITYLPLFMSDSFGSSSLATGIVVSSAAFATVLTTLWVGRLASLVPAASLIRASFALYALSLCLVPLATEQWFLIIPAVILGIAHGINLPNVVALLAEFATIGNRGAIMSINGMIFRLGQTLGPLLMGVVVMVWSLNGAFFTTAVLALVMFALVTVLVE